VYDYLKPMKPYSQVPQDLYMAVFYPVARKWPSNQEFSPAVKKVNPGIVKVQDYVDKVEAASKRFRPVLSAAEQSALNTTAAKLGVTADSLYKLINFESSWDPQATNRYTGARGLIQFMPATARSMGFAAAMTVLPLLAVGGIVYLYLHRRGII
jgi:soluble lytic murein transglycosylase-like protein